MSEIVNINETQLNTVALILGILALIAVFMPLVTYNEFFYVNIFALRGITNLLLFAPFFIILPAILAIKGELQKSEYWYITFGVIGLLLALYAYNSGVYALRLLIGFKVHGGGLAYINTTPDIGSILLFVSYFGVFLIGLVIQAKKKDSQLNDENTKAKLGSKTIEETIAEIHNGFVLFDLGKYQEAIRYYDKAIKLNPRDTIAYMGKGIALYYLGKYQEAISCYDKAIELDPKNTEVYYNKALALDKLGKYQEAISCYDKAIELDPKNTEVYSGKGFTLSDLGKYQEAISCFDKAIELDPKNTRAYFSKGYALFHLGQYQEAIKYYDKAIALDPNDAATYYNKGIALYNLKKYQESISCFDKAIELDPNDTAAYNAKNLAQKNLTN